MERTFFRWISRALRPLLLAWQALGPAAAIGAAAGVGGQTAALASLGEKRSAVGDRWRGAHAALIGRELAQQAIRADRLTPEILQRAHGDTRALDEMVRVLTERRARLSPDLATQLGSLAARSIGAT